MLSVLLTADWHLGKLFKHTEFSLLEVQEKLLEELVSVAEENEIDLVLVAGDVFDSYNPSFRAEALFYRTLVRLSAEGRRPVIVCAGNHDAPEKFEVPRPLMGALPGVVLLSRPEEDLSFLEAQSPWFSLKKEGGFLKIHFREKEITVALKVLPYPSEVRWGLAGEEYQRRLASFLGEEPSFTTDYYFILSHLWTEGGQEAGSERLSLLGGAEKIPLSYFSEKAHLVALGHLHRFQQVRENVFYPGALFPFTIKEARDEKGVLLWQDGKVRFRPLRRAPQVKECHFSSLEEALEASPFLEDELVFLRFPPLGLSPKEIAQLKKAFAGRLLGLQFALPPPEEPLPSLKDFHPEDLFREFLRQKTGQEPDQELVSLFLHFVSQVRESES